MALEPGNQRATQEQLEEHIKSLASMTALFWRHLKDNGVPDEVAQELTYILTDRMTAHMEERG
jgi:hypothetical protein